ncbi:MAG: serine kinase [Sphingobacteriia bacterium]|nr:serine kinase [Sphingobacteriia bacterium]
MTVNEIVKKLNLTVYSGETGLNNQITGGYTSDLLSDVMGHSNQGNIWVTLQTHKNVIAIASLKDLAAVILVKGLKPDEDTLAKSREENIPMLGTTLPAFEITGQIFQLIHHQEMAT